MLSLKIGCEIQSLGHLMLTCFDPYGFLYIISAQMILLNDTKLLLFVMEQVNKLASIVVILLVQRLSQLPFILFLAQLSLKPSLYINLMLRMSFFIGIFMTLSTCINLWVFMIPFILLKYEKSTSICTVLNKHPMHGILVFLLSVYFWFYAQHL